MHKLSHPHVCLPYAHRPRVDVPSVDSARLASPIISLDFSRTAQGGDHYWRSSGRIKDLYAEPVSSGLSPTPINGGLPGFYADGTEGFKITTRPTFSSFSFAMAIRRDVGILDRKRILWYWAGSLALGGFYIHLASGTARPQVYVIGGGSSVATIHPSSISEIEHDVIVFTYDYGTGVGIVYLNGIAGTPSASLVTTFAPANDFFIFQQNSGSNRFTGDIPILRLWDFTLNSTEILSVTRDIAFTVGRNLSL